MNIKLTKITVDDWILCIFPTVATKQNFNMYSEIKWEKSINKHEKTTIKLVNKAIFSLFDRCEMKTVYLTERYLWRDKRARYLKTNSELNIYCFQDTKM